MWLTNPPFNVSYVSKTKDALIIKNDKMSRLVFRQFLMDAYLGADVIMKAGAVFYIWHSGNTGYNFLRGCTRY